MASWQFTVVLIPTSWAEENNYNSSKLCSEQLYCTECVWKGSPINSELQHILSSVLPPSQSWHEKLLTWGNEDEHDIQVRFRSESVDSIRIRLDLRHQLNEMFIKVVKAAHALNCAFFFPEFESIVDANEFQLKSATLKSCAARFVSRNQIRIRP